jgi:hypothetical protein
MNLECKKSRERERNKKFKEGRRIRGRACKETLEMKFKWIGKILFHKLLHCFCV